MVVLRFLEGKSLKQAGDALGVSEDAAKMRILRPLEKLRKLFCKRGVALSSAAIAGAMAGNSAQAAPEAPAKTIVALAVAKGAAAGTSTLTLVKGTLKLMAWTKAKTAMAIAASIIVTGGMTLVVTREVIQAKELLSTSAAADNPFSDVAMQLSPFTSVAFDADTVMVTYLGDEYRLVAVNKIYSHLGAGTARAPDGNGHALLQHHVVAENRGDF